MIYKKVFLPAFIYVITIATVLAGDFNTLYRTGLRKLNNRNYEGALSDFKKAYNSAELSQEEVRILFAIANVYARQKKYKDAKNWMLRVLDIPDLKQKDKISTYRYLISYSTARKHYDDALDEIRTALRIAKANDDKVIFLTARARVYELQKNYQETVETLQECINISERSSPQWQRTQQQLIAVLYKQKKYESILNLMPKLQTAGWNPSSKEIIYYYGGLSAVRLKKYEQAIDWFKNISDGGRSWLMYSKNTQLGKCWENLHKYEKAYACFELIYKNNKLQNYYRAKGLEMMAETRYTQKKYEEAKKLCEELKNFPKASKTQIKQAERLIKKIKAQKP